METLPAGSQATLGDTMGLYAQKRRKQPLPAAMKAAYKKYGIATPEMAAEGFAMPCAQCGKLELPGEKHKTCACRAEGIKYCGADCQKAHWKAGHKASCATKQGGSSSGERVVAAAAALADVSLTSSSGVDGGGGSIRQVRKQPSKAAIDRMMKRSQQDSSMPIPGTEDCEAWKVVVRRLRDLGPPSTRRQVDEEIEQSINIEADFWVRYPNSPNWALGTGFSTEAEFMAYMQAKESRR